MAKVCYPLDLLRFEELAWVALRREFARTGVDRVVPAAANMDPTPSENASATVAILAANSSARVRGLQRKHVRVGSTVIGSPGLHFECMTEVHGIHLGRLQRVHDPSRVPRKHAERRCTSASQSAHLLTAYLLDKKQVMSNS